MNLANLRKVESPGPRRAAADVGGMVTAIVKVKKPGYRPAGVKVRGEISGEIFTAEFPAELLGTLEKDAAIASIALSRTLQASPKPSSTE